MYGGSGVRAASHVAGVVDSERLAVITARQHTYNLQVTSAGGHERARVAAVWRAGTPDELAAEIDLVHHIAFARERSDFRYRVALGRCCFPRQRKRSHKRQHDFANLERHSLDPPRPVSF